MSAEVQRGWFTRRPRVLRVLWLTLVWVLLWGTFSWANLLGGLAVAIVVLALFPLPAVSTGGRLRPLALVRVFLDVARDLVVSSVQVAWQSVRPGPPIRSSIVAVEVSEDSELLMAMLVECLSLVPGSVVVEASAEERMLWAHVLGADDDAAVERFRAQVARLEADLLAVGLAQVRVEPTSSGRTEAGTDPLDDPEELLEDDEPDRLDGAVRTREADR
ncbi:Na+/H+ antiporter subunit E [Actinomycetospora termitidis]|uniref:Na+/H+ antiporter subunit E n=1 Tax=Actinomycetospora termitidis TaxID=3053470 RepID=A0ABT7M3U3_9PSEU|nr:Na+/H+ antiporter subunit E [Actinomycetospora sp. Odt1-22]MDL5155341.1 Na+/H+ antiporter subunit E [Actinomycetospora sp. Odt1-22]